MCPYDTLLLFVTFSTIHVYMHLSSLNPDKCLGRGVSAYQIINVSDSGRSDRFPIMASRVQGETPRSWVFHSSHSACSCQRLAFSRKPPALVVRKIGASTVYALADACTFDRCASLYADSAKISHLCMLCYLYSVTCTLCYSCLYYVAYDTGMLGCRPPLDHWL